MIDKESHTAQMIRQNIEHALGVESQTYLYADFPSHAEIDDRCVERAADAMKEKLAQKRADGRGRWWDSFECKTASLQKMLKEHVEKGDPIDVMNIAMMLFCRGERTNSEPEKYTIGTNTMRHVFEPNGMTDISNLQAVFDAIEIALSSQQEQVPTHRHKKRGTEYALVGIGKMQTEHWRDPNLDAEYDNQAVDMRDVAIYRSVDGGKLWVRPTEEFNDGRFETLWSGAKSTTPALFSQLPYQERVQAAHHALFHDDPTDIPERNARALEESMETAQAFGMSRDEALALVDYTFSRPVGDPRKELGAKILTAFSLGITAGIDVMAAAEDELQKMQLPETIARIRAKRATRHGRGPLPGFDPAAPIAKQGEPK